MADLIERVFDFLQRGDFTQSERRQFRELVMETRHIGGPDGFREWMRQCVRPLYPHAAGVVGIGELSYGRIDISLILGVDCPEEYLKALHAGSKLGQSPTFLRWSRGRRPLLLDPAADPHCLTADELRLVARHGLGSIAAHGLLDAEGGRGSYFNLFGMPGQIGPRDGLLLALLAPALHRAAERLLGMPAGAAPQKPENALNATELNILRLLIRGRSRLEISLALNQRDAIVQNHCDRIFAKLGTRNRAEAVRRAIELGLPEPDGQG